MRYKITVQYDGSEYHGWQKQPGVATVQGELERAIEHITQKPTSVNGSGRTDEGVHALGQVAHFDSDREYPPERFTAALNYWLPDDIRVVGAEQVSDDFDARKSAKRKTYEYLFYSGEYPNPLKRKRELYVKKLDIEKMNEAAKVFIGVHDFKAFHSTGSSAKTTIREVYEAEVTGNEKFGIFSITGNGFLYNMVRIMAAALVKVAEGKIDKAYLKKALLCSDRQLVPDVAPPYALYLKKVEYSKNLKK